MLSGPDDLRVGVEAAGPESMAEDDDFFAVGKVLFRREGAAAERRGAEEAEVIGADLRGLELLGEPATGEVDDSATEGGHILNRAGLFAPVLELGGGGALEGALRRGVQEEDHAVGVWKRSRFEEDGVDNGKDGGIGADAQGEGGDGRESESGTLPEDAQ